MKNKIFSLILFLVFSGTLYSSVPKTANIDVPKNIIIMIGDGMGFANIDATNFYQSGKSDAQKFEQFPVRLAMATHHAATKDKSATIWNTGYNSHLAWSDFAWSKNNATCSGAAATAMSTGQKTFNGAIGVDLEGKELKHIKHSAKKLNKAVGIVTSVQLSHATPAGFVAHNTNRTKYKEIATQMLVYSNLDVLMGCGHPYYNTNGEKLEKVETYKYVGDSLIWHSIINRKTEVVVNDKKVTLPDINGDGSPDSWHLLETRDDFLKYIQGDTPTRILGVPRVATTLQQERYLTNSGKLGFISNGKESPYEVQLIEDVPTLEDMSKVALNALSKNNKGFFLMVEAGAIDWAAHSNQSGRLIEETIDFYKSIDAVIQWIETNSSWSETLLIVTSDHECGYLTGPKSGGKPPVWNEIENNGIGKLPGMEWHSGGHTNHLVPFFAKGAGSDIFQLLADEVDSKRGKYIQNTEIAIACFLLWGR